jgi:hypothetical protein
MNVSELIACLQKLPQDMEVLIRHPAQCCCGMCYASIPDYIVPEPEIASVYGYGPNGLETGNVLKVEI